MREIKFRAWHDSETGMVMLPKVAYLGQTGIIDNFVGADKAQWMQYTGIKDDDNNEIWEGDIVQFTSTLCGDKLIKTIVEYNENIGSFVFEMGNDEGFWQYDASMNNVKVIGNIYQQPELLDQ